MTHLRHRVYGTAASRGCATIRCGLPLDRSSHPCRCAPRARPLNPNPAHAATPRARVLNPNPANAAPARARAPQAFLLCAMKMHWHLRAMAQLGRSAARDPRLVLRAVQVGGRRTRPQ